MPPSPAACPPRSRTLLALAFAALGIAASMAVSEADPSFNPACAAWDRDATAALGRLIGEHDPVVERRLNDAVFRLLRARKNCRNGWTEIARRDYEALIGGRYGGYNRNR